MYFVEKIKGINYVRQFDYSLFISVVVLSIAGLIVLNSATLTMSGRESIMKTQILSLIIGVIASLVISFLDYNSFKSVALLMYLASVGLLMLVLFIGYGYKEVGSKSWLIIHVKGYNISFQPAELSKITMVILISCFLERIKEKQDVGKNIIKLIVFFLLVAGLILKQPDYGMAIVFFVALFIMIYISGVKYKHLFIAAGALLFTTPFIWFFALNEDRKKRILEFISPGYDPGGASYQLERAQIAIGSGRIYGSGLYKGIQTQTPPHVGGVPVRESDMIFTVIGEELGFIGSVLIIALILFIIIRCFYIAINSRDIFGALLVTGLTGMMAYQFLQNIGMCVRLLPVTGLPLPFVSAGGSAMITNYISIGIILSVSIRRKRTMFSSQQ
ncbi:MAG: rod shape-determining protein RodA [Clostridiaceae bacterium]|nr:rod shape-determining protein RodA [Clostridiaceae bacterium]